MFTQGDKEALCEKHLKDPQPGDYWNEMCVPYLIVIQAMDDGIVVSLPQRTPKGFFFEGEKAVKVTREWMKNYLMYSSGKGFVGVYPATAENNRAAILDSWNSAGRPCPWRVEPENPKKPLSEIERLREDLAAVTAQRDELLEALKTLKESYLEAGEQMSREQRIAGRNALLAASTAIAKCEVQNG